MDVRERVNEMKFKRLDESGTVWIDMGARLIEKLEYTQTEDEYNHDCGWRG